MGRYGSPESHELYNRLIAEWLANGCRLPPQSTDIESLPPTVAEVVLAYHRYAHLYYRDSDGNLTSEARLVDEAMSHLRRLYGRTAASDFGPKKLKVVRQAMVDSGLARVTVNRYVGRIKRWLKWATEEELIPGAVFEQIRSLSGLKKGKSQARETDPVQPVTDAAVQATLPYLSSVVSDMVRFQRLTGARPGEVCRIRPRDIDRSESVWLYHPAKHTTEHFDRSRVIAIGRRAQEVLRRYLLRPDDAYCFSPKDAERRRECRCNRSAQNAQVVRKSRRNESKVETDARAG